MVRTDDGSGDLLGLVRGMKNTSESVLKNGNIGVADLVFSFGGPNGRY